MSDQRSVMKEFRFLDQKRQTTGLSAEESTRYAQLRDLVGPDTAAPPRAGFDVNAAAARLRESLLPGGLRGQVPAPPLEPELPPEPEVEGPPEAPALEAAWEAQPLDAEAAPAPDLLFEPSSMGTEVRPQAWNPEAPGYDPDAPYDEAAWIAAGYDPNASYDWSAYAPEGQATQAEPTAEQPEPMAGAEPPFEGGPAPQLDEPEAVVFDAGQVEMAAEELPFDPHAPFDHAKWFGRAPAAPAPGFDEAVPVELVGEVLEAPELEPLVELTPELELPPESAPPQAGAEAAWSAAAAARPPGIAEDLALHPVAEPYGEPASEAPAGSTAAIAEPYADLAAAPGAVEAPEPSAAEPALDLEAAAGAAAWPDAAAEPPAPLDLGSEPAPEPILEAAASDSWFDAASEPPPAPALAFGDYDADARGVPAGLAAMMVEPLPEPPAPAGDAVDLVGDGSATPYQAAPEGAPFGDYDETAAGSAPALALEEASLDALPFDPAAASAIEPGGMPEGYATGSLTLDPAALPPAPAGGYDDPAYPADADYGGPEGDSLPGGTPLELGEPVQDWLPEQALEQGFQLASDGSFGEVDHPVLTPVPGWATVEEVAAATAATAAAHQAAGWESPPALDLTASFDLAPPPAEPGPAQDLPPEPAAEAAPAEPAFDAPAVEPLLEAPAEELPTLVGDDILEELPPSEVAAAVELAPDPAPAPIPAAFVDEATYQGEIPPEIAAAFGDAPAAADPFAAGEPEPILEELPPPAPEPETYVEPEPLPGPDAAPQVWIEGSHRVVLHTVDGQVKRGLLVDAALDAVELALRPQGPGAPEVVATDNVKAIFFMLAPGEKAATPEGKKVRVTFRDGRQVAGYSPDYVEGTIGFFMIPADTRTNTGRIWVYQAAVRQVAVS